MISLKKYFLITAGCISLFLGIAGIFLPILPTTPFLLLSAACFLKSSQHLYIWLTTHRIFGSYIRNYLKYKAITVKTKIISLSMLWVLILTSALFFAPFLWLKILLLFIALCVSIHLIMIKTLTPEMIAQEKSIIELD